MTAPRRDKLIECIDCRVHFPFTVREQEFYEAKQYADPKRCRACRQARKAGRSEGHEPRPVEPVDPAPRRNRRA